MELSKIIFRFNQFGGWRLIRAYLKKGAFPIMMKELWRVVIHGLPLKETYPRIRRFVSPILKEEYTPLLHELANKYKDIKPGRKNDVVWFGWLQGIENAPEMVKVCYWSQKKYIKDKTFIEISYENYKKYVTLPDFIIEKYEKKIIPAAHFSDLLRLELLITHGGTWIDSTVLCTGADYPKQIMDSELFFYQYFRKGAVQSNGISNWFISAYSNNKLLMILRDMLYQYWQDYDCVLEYFVFHLFFRMITELYPEDVAAMPKQNSYPAIALEYKLKENYDAEWMDKVKTVSCFHKLNYRATKGMIRNSNSFYNHILALPITDD